jgi:agmatinase
MDVVGLLTSDVYVSVDLDVFDPALMPAVGTPEPGGMDWGQVTSLLWAVGRHRRIVGFDVTELSPDLGPPACAYIAAKLVYKLVAYATLLPAASSWAGISLVSGTETTSQEQRSFPYAGT